MEKLKLEFAYLSFFFILFFYLSSFSGRFSSPYVLLFIQEDGVILVSTCKFLTYLSQQYLSQYCRDKFIYLILRVLVIINIDIN